MLKRMGNLAAGVLTIGRYLTLMYKRMGCYLFSKHHLCVLTSIVYVQSHKVNAQLKAHLSVKPIKIGYMSKIKLTTLQHIYKRRSQEGTQSDR